MNLRKRVEQLEEVASSVGTYQALYDKLSALSDEELLARYEELTNILMRDPAFASRVERMTLADVEAIDLTRDPALLSDEELERHVAAQVWMRLEGDREG